MNELLCNLLNALDAVAESNEEIYDTECRQQMSDVVFHLFVKPTENYQAPIDFGLHDDRANQLVRTALMTYITAANTTAKRLGLSTFQARLAQFQNSDVVSATQGNYFDDFFGWMNPADYDDAGNPFQNRG